MGCTVSAASVFAPQMTVIPIAATNHNTMAIVSARSASAIISPVKFTIEWIKEKKIAYHLVAAGPIKEVKVIDDHTVRYILHYPYAPLLSYTGEQIYILPEHIWKDVPEKVGVDDPIMWFYYPILSNFRSFINF